jgi:hypothetical protein
MKILTALYTLQKPLNDSSPWILRKPICIYMALLEIILNVTLAFDLLTNIFCKWLLKHTFIKTQGNQAIF